MFRNLNRFLISAASVLAVMVMAQAYSTPAHAVLVDNFDDRSGCSQLLSQCQFVADDGAASVSVNNPQTLVQIQANGGDAIGDRNLFVDKTGGDGTVSATVQAGHFNHAQDPSAKGFSQVTWSNFGTVDFTGVVIAVNVLFNDNGGNIIFRVSDDGGVTYSYETIVLAAGVTGLQYYDISSFTLFSGAAADLTAINWVQLEVDGRNSAGLDVEIDIIAEVAEPATLGMFGIGLLALGYFTRRRRRQDAMAA